MIKMKLMHPSIVIAGNKAIIVKGMGKGVYEPLDIPTQEWLRAESDMRWAEDMADRPMSDCIHISQHERNLMEFDFLPIW